MRTLYKCHCVTFTYLAFAGLDFCIKTVFNWMSIIFIVHIIVIPANVSSIIPRETPKSFKKLRLQKARSHPGPVARNFYDFRYQHIVKAPDFTFILFSLIILYLFHFSLFLFYFIDESVLKTRKN